MMNNRGNSAFEAKLFMQEVFIANYWRFDQLAEKMFARLYCVSLAITFVNLSKDAHSIN